MKSDLNSGFAVVLETVSLFHRYRPTVKWRKTETTLKSRIILVERTMQVLKNMEFLKIWKVLFNIDN